MSSIGHDRHNAKPRKPWLSGFCGVDLPADSHERCRGAYEGALCGCSCHKPSDVGAPTTHPAADAADSAGGAKDESGTLAPTSEIKPGLVCGMDDETYHADPVPSGSLSSTFARLLTEHVPAKAAERRKRKPTKAMELGKAAHSHALGAGPELIVWQHDGRTKEGKAERAHYADLLATEAAVAVTEAQRDQILGMADALRAEPAIRTILESCDAEVSGFWQEESVWMRARYDLLCDMDAWDYKTTRDSSRRGFQRAMAEYGYHQQAEFYQRGLNALGHSAGKRPLRFICQETEAPYLVQIHTPDEAAMDVARELNDRAIRIYAEATATGIWAGYEQLIAEPTSLPAFYFYDHEEALGPPMTDLGLVF